MNQLAHLTGIKFKDLNISQLTEVIYIFCDQNRYEYYINHNCKNTEEIIKNFEDNYYNIEVLKQFFKYWTN